MFVKKKIEVLGKAAYLLYLHRELYIFFLFSDSKTVFLGKSNGHFTVKDLSTGECIHEQDYQKSIKMLLTSKSGKEIILIPETEDDIIILNSRTCKY